MLSFVFGVASCKRSDEGGHKDAAMTILGSGNLLNSSNIVPLPDGGFLIGTTVHRPADADYGLYRFDASGKLIWERIYPTVGIESIQKVLINNKNEILIAGFTYGYGQDSISLEESRIPQILLMLLDMNGEKIWARPVQVADYPDADQMMTDLIQDTEGNYILTLHHGWFAFDNSNNTLYSGNHGIVVKIRENGTLSNYCVSKYDPGVPAVFERSASYGCVLFEKDTRRASFAHLSKSFFQRLDGYVNKSSIWIPVDVNSEGLIPSMTCSLKRYRANGNPSFVVFSDDRCFELIYDLNTEQLSYSNLPENIKGVQAADEMENGDVLLKLRTGEVLRTDPDFNILNSHEVPVPFSQISELANGNIVYSRYHGKSIYIYLTNEHGEPIEGQ